MFLPSKSFDIACQYRVVLVLFCLVCCLLLPSQLLAVLCNNCGYTYDHQYSVRCPVCQHQNYHPQHGTTHSESATQANPALRSDQLQEYLELAVDVLSHSAQETLENSFISTDSLIHTLSLLFTGTSGESLRMIQRCECGFLFSREAVTSCPMCKHNKNGHTQHDMVSFLSATPVKPDSYPAQQGDESQRNLELAINVFSHAAREMPGNFVISPDGLFQSLALLLMGADGLTRHWLEDCLGEDYSEPSGAEGASAASGGQEQYCIANCLLVSSQLQLQDTYRARLKQINADIHDNVDFSNRTSIESLAQALNHLFCQLTHGMVREFCDSQQWQSDTLMAIISSVYFKGLWERSFSTRSARLFTLSSNQAVVLDRFMRGEIDHSQYVNHNDWEAVTVPYQGDHEMILVLPPTGIMPHEVSTEIIAALLSSFESEESYSSSSTMGLELPAFKVNSKTDLNKALQQAGLHFLLESPSLGAMLSHTTTISGVFFNQHCALEVNEAGTRASAARHTCATGGCGGGTRQSIIFDRPFLYILRNKITKRIIFIGQVLDPGSSSESRTH